MEASQITESIRDGGLRRLRRDTGILTRGDAGGRMPDGDPDGAFATFVGTFAAALDEGDDPADAFRSSIEAEGWTTAGD